MAFRPGVPVDSDLPMDLTRTRPLPTRRPSSTRSPPNTGRRTSRRTRCSPRPSATSGSTTGWPTTTPEGSAATRATFADLLDRVDELDPRTLAGEDQTTPPTLRETLAADIAELDTGLLDWNVDPLEGVPADFLDWSPTTSASRPRRTASRMVARWRAMGRLHRPPRCDSLRAQPGRGHGRLRWRPVERTIAILEQPARRADDADWPLLDAARRRSTSVEGWSAAERDAVRRASFAAVVDDDDPAGVHPAPRRPRDRDPARRPPRRSEPGMCHVPGGADGYRRADPRAHVARPRGRRRSTASASTRSTASTPSSPSSRAAPSGRRALGHALSRACARDPALYFATPRRGVRQGRRPASPGRREAVPDWFGRLPLAACEVDPRWAAHEEDHSTHRLLPPAARSTARGPASTSSTRPSPRRGRATRPEALAYHESVPGPPPPDRDRPGAATGCPTFRRHLGPTAFFEGWGLYTERLADEMGLYSGDLDRLGVLSFDAWRAARLVVDTGIHAMGWSRERAIAFMLDHTALAPNNIANEVDRYIVLPGQALAYKLGQLELLRLRDRGPARGSAPRSTSAASTTRSWAAARSPCRRCAASSRPGPRGGSPRADGRQRGSAPPDGRSRSPPGPCRVLRNRDIRSLELAWTLGIAADWALLVVALLVAYDAGGAVLVGLVSLVRMLPATVVNLFVDTGRFAAARARAGRGQPRPGRRRARVVAAAIVVDQPVARVRWPSPRASAAGALVRPTTLALLPSVARTPGRAGLREHGRRARRERWARSSGRSSPASSIASLRRRRRRPRSRRRSCVIAAAGRVARHASPMPPGPPRRRTGRHGLDPLLAGIRELVRRRPAGRRDDVAVRRQVAVRGALTTFIAILAPRGPGHGRRGRRHPRRGHRAGRDRRARWSALAHRAPAAGSRPCSRARAGRRGARRSRVIGVAASPARRAPRARGRRRRQRAARRRRGSRSSSAACRTRPAAAVFAVLEVAASIGISIGGAARRRCWSTTLGRRAGAGRHRPRRCRSRPSSAGRRSAASTTRASCRERQARLLRGIPLFAAAAAGRAGARRRRDARRSTSRPAQRDHDPGRARATRT